MSKGSGISRSDRRRNARRERLRGLLPRDGAVLGIDLGDAKQALALAGHDMRVLWRRNPRCAAHQLGGPIAEAAGAAARAGMPRLTVACEPAGSRWMQVQRLCGELGVALVCVQPLVSHIAREQEDYTGHKRDEPDAVLIARLACELHCYIPEELDESWACLRQLGRRRAQLVTTATAAGAADPGFPVGRVAVGGDRCGRPVRLDDLAGSARGRDLPLRGGPGPAGRGGGG